VTTLIELDDFTRSYAECALWATNDESDDRGGEPMDSNYTVDDIAPETLEKMAEDCRRFQAENAADLALYNHPQWSAAELGGHDLWLTRNGHGCGFWDRNDCLPEDAGERLTEAAKKYGEVYLYVGDDGLIFSE
jgi:hypothetical protein